MATKPTPGASASLATYVVLVGTVVTGAGDDRVETPAGETVELSEKDAAPLLKSETIRAVAAPPAAAPEPAKDPAKDPAT